MSDESVLSQNTLIDGIPNEIQFTIKNSLSRLKIDCPFH